MRASAIEEVDSERHFLRSKLHLVDLAGSERLDDTGAEGEQRKGGGGLLLCRVLRLPGLRGLQNAATCAVMHACWGA